MSDRFHPISMEQLTNWVFTELGERNSLFNVPRSAFFVPRLDHRFRTHAFGVEMGTPFGVAAGPHTQMAQNIVAAWLVGARLIELKTVQTLDEIHINKPCIDLQDEGYNVEWSQELKIHQSFDEYLRAWVLIHALHHRFGWPGDRPGVVFNMSVGYDLEGILKPNVRWYLDAMADASKFLPAYVEIVARHYPAVRLVEIPARISDTITVSTMHGCPPDEIEAISRYLLEERGLHTSVKCNPTLLGADRVRGIVNGDLGFDEVPIPDSAFEHDLKYADAVPVFQNLRRVAAARGLFFGLKLSNTLEVENWRNVFDHDPTMYLSGRPLHPVTTSLAATLTEELGGDLPLSFAGGADCFNVADLLGAGMRTVTVCSDLLKTGGYLRLLQYTESVEAAFDAVGAHDTADFICRSALRRPEIAAFVPLMCEGSLNLEPEQCGSLLETLKETSGAERVTDRARSWALEAGRDAGRAAEVADLAVTVLARINLQAYAESTRSDWRYKRTSFRMDRSKTPRRLQAFDCIAAPCVDACPVDQAVPHYMDAARRGEFAEAVRITRQDNPLPSILGRVCDHPCENTCVRTHLDQPLAIRQIKRFIMEQERAVDGPAPYRAPRIATRVAIVGAGPAGLAAARDLARDGFGVTVFEAHPYAGGMAGGAIPTYRLPQAQIDQDLTILERLGVEVRYGMTGGVDFTIDTLRADGFASVLIAVGAQRARRLDLPGADADGVIDGIEFLRSVRKGRPMAIGPRVGVVGAGDSAMDCVRSALRVGASAVSLIYRRTIDQMPADPEEVCAIQEEGVEIVELARPEALHIEGGRLAGLVCTRTEYRGARDSAGRKIPFDVAGSAFEVGLDTLILAIGQHAVLDLFGARPPALTTSGFIAVDPETLETSIPGIYAGGDVAGHGPASVVRAAADGKRVAAAITAAFGRVRMEPADKRRRVDVDELVVRRARRAYRVPVRVSPLDSRAGFDETVLGYTAEEAIREASRCLDCHELCSLCVGVCPNMALLTYRLEPVRAELPSLVVLNGAFVTRGSVRFVVDQRYQVAVLTDFCNECGNCVTACPTSGAPYRDKPRLYLDWAEFAAQESNAFLLLGNAVMQARFGGRTHRIEVNDRIDYTAPTFRAILHRETFGLLEATPTGAADGDVLSLEPAAVMVTLLDGLARSMPHIPTVAEGGTFVAQPGH
jgi:NADPH-dependent glutamate synthase beta subunit-like oxidoreductase